MVCFIFHYEVKITVTYESDSSSNSGSRLYNWMGIMLSVFILATLALSDSLDLALVNPQFMEHKWTLHSIIFVIVIAA